MKKPPKKMVRISGYVSREDLKWWKKMLARCAKLEKEHVKARP